MTTFPDPEIENEPTEVTAVSERDSVFPVSFAQRRLWFLDRLEPGSVTYIVPSPVRIEGALEVGILHQALQALVDRHEPFRTTFRIIDAQPMQVILPSATLDMPVRDLTCFTPEEREREVARLMSADAQMPFDLARDLMLRVKLLRLSPVEHVLLATMHHIAFDGWSAGIFYRDLAELYAAFSSGREPDLPELQIQYADFAAWQRQWMEGDVLREQIDYWKQQLAGAPALLEFPLDHPRPAVQSYRGAVVRFSVAKPIAEALNAVSREEGCTLFMTLLAAFQVLASRCTGQQDIVIGSPIANRNRAEIEDIIGCFINTLVFRTDLSGDPTFRELLARVQETALDAYAHQDLPFEKLVEELQPTRAQSHSPIFQVMFILQNTPAPADVPGGLRWKFIEVENGTTKFDLTLGLTETENGLEGGIGFATDLFDPASMERLAAHYKMLLEGIVAHPDEPISRLPILPETERRQLVVEWNRTEADFSRTAGVHELIEAQAARTPDAIAARFENQSLTYAQLNERANQLAQYLQSLGVGPEVLVGICLERSLEMLVAMLAILKAGGAYVPLDPNYPKDRLDFVLQDSGAGVLVTQQSLRDRLWKTDSAPPETAFPKLVCLDANEWQKSSPAQPRAAVRPENLAYVLYTSGSTGKPKGVQIPHRALVNFLESMQQAPGLSREDVLLAITTLSFDIAELELLLPLITGAQVVIARTETALDGKALAAEIERCGATVMQATPATWRLLLNAGWQGKTNLKILCGGEAWPEELARELLPRCASLWNMYGPTETTVWSALSRVKPNETPLISSPIANTQLYILDAQLQPAPIGVAGELHIGGDGLARGYLNRPELTAEKFIPDPFRSEPGARIYKTGDLARYRSDGQIEFLGRLDHQVKIRGFRIELGEIQSLLSEHPAVRETVVVAREDVSGEKRLVGYVVFESESTAQTGQIDLLRAHLKTRLPEYMVPSAFVVLEKFPLTPNGKVDRKQLPAPEATRSDKVSVAPRDSLELQLVQLWQKIFSVEPISIRDNFFELGGHSLLAVRLFSEIEKITGKNLPMVTLFQAPTIEALAAVLKQDGWEPPWSSLVPIKPGGSRPPFYCVHGVGGNILEYLDLAKYMDDPQPFYGLQAVGLDGKRPWLETVEEMAAHYISEIQNFQARGPYCLGGSSFGGLVAFEMAQQLRAKGEEVALLALFDAHAPGYPKFLPATSVWRAKWNHSKFRFSLHWGNLKAAEGAEKFNYIGRKIAKWSRGQVIMMKRRKKERRERARQKSLPQTIVETQKVGMAAHDSYSCAKKYPGPATLFRATVQLDGIEKHPTLGWSDFIDGTIEVYDTPGHHGSIVRDPRAKILAAQLKESLQKAQTAMRKTHRSQSQAKCSH